MAKKKPGPANMENMFTQQLMNMMNPFAAPAPSAPPVSGPARRNIPQQTWEHYAPQICSDDHALTLPGGETRNVYFGISCLMAALDAKIMTGVEIIP
jgi:hypothetical protein